MRAATSFLFAAALLCVAGCNKTSSPDENVAAGNLVIDNNMAGADIETLPPDESSATPSNQLANGDDNPDVNDLGNNSSDY